METAARPTNGSSGVTVTPRHTASRDRQTDRRAETAVHAEANTPSRAMSSDSRRLVATLIEYRRALVPIRSP